MVLIHAFLSNKPFKCPFSQMKKKIFSCMIVMVVLVNILGLRCQLLIVLLTLDYIINTP